MQYLSISMAAEALHKSSGFVRKRIEEGEIKAMRRGNRQIIEKEEIIRYINEGDITVNKKHAIHMLRIEENLFNELEKKGEIKYISTISGKRYNIQELKNFIERRNQI